MHARWLVSLAVVSTACFQVAVGETTSSYSLEELRAVARTAHPTLDSAEAAVQAAAGVVRQARAYPNPGIALAAGRGRPRDGGDFRSENAIVLVQPIEVGGIRKWRARSAELRQQGVELDRVLAGTVVDSTVSRLAYTVLLERRRAEVARESEKIALRLRQLLDRRVELGESSPLEAVKAKSEWFARRREVVDAENTLAAVRFALDLFCGNRLPRGFQVSETLEGTRTIALPDDLVERLLRHNPVLLKTGVAVDEAEARTKVARKGVFPRLDLIAGHETELDRTGSSLGVGLTIPLWNRNRGEVATATAEHLRASAETRAARMEIETALQRASASYRGALAAVRLHQEGWTAVARRSLEIATFSFENGEASLLDVLDAQRSYLGVSLAEAEAWASLAFARTEVERLIAGPLEMENANETD